MNFVFITANRKVASRKIKAFETGSRAGSLDEDFAAYSI